MSHASPCWTTRHSSSQCAAAANWASIHIWTGAATPRATPLLRPPACRLARQDGPPRRRPRAAHLGGRLTSTTSITCMQFVIIDALRLPDRYDRPVLMWLLRKAYIGFRAAHEAGFEQFAAATRCCRSQAQSGDGRLGLWCVRQRNAGHVSGAGVGVDMLYRFMCVQLAAAAMAGVTLVFHAYTAADGESLTAALARHGVAELMSSAPTAADVIEVV